MKQSLCLTCRNANIVEGYAEGHRRVECHYYCYFVEWPVRRCTKYDDKRLTTVDQMERIAWFVVPRNGGRSIGFVKAQELRRLNENEES